MRIRHITEGIHDPNIFKALYLLGGPGSGKSFVAKNLTAGAALKSINVDNIYEYLTQRRGVVGGYTDDIYSFAGRVVSKQIHTYVNGRLGLLMDSTGRNMTHIIKSKQMLEELGYDIMAVHVDVDVLVALDRNDERKRRVDPSFLRQVHAKVDDNLDALRGLFGNNYLTFKNNDWDEFKQSMNTVGKKVRNFLNAPPRKPQAQEWLKKQRERDAVTESFTDDQLNDAKHFLDKNQDEILPWLKSIHYDLNHTLFRGMKKVHDTIKKVSTPVVDRKPMDTEAELHILFNQAIEDAGKTANRSNALFTSGNESYTKRYGHPHVIIPIGEFHYTWSSEWRDWFLINSMYARSLYPYDEKARQMALDAFLEAMSKLKQSIKGDDGSLPQAIATGHEVMLHCPNGYYIIPTETYEAIIHYTTIDK